MNDRWSESFGEAARRLAQTPTTDMELGKILQHIYTRMEEESMRDARENFNKAQQHSKGRREDNPQIRDCKHTYPEDR